jgi:serine O-acetyltransferase
MAALIMGPVTVGDWSQVGAQSLVIKDVPARAIVAGSPARVLRMVDDVPVGPIC